MKESIGYTVTLNIVIVFIVVIFAFLSAAIIYFKSNKISNVIMNSIEKYEGYNSLSKSDITLQMESLGYNKSKITCATDKCTLLNDGKDGYCVYECDGNEDYYYYKVRTNMSINIPIINDLLNIPVYSNTNYIYNYEKNLK